MGQKSAVRRLIQKEAVHVDQIHVLMESLAQFIPQPICLCLQEGFCSFHQEFDSAILASVTSGIGTKQVDPGKSIRFGDRGHKLLYFFFCDTNTPSIVNNRNQFRF